jgi:uridine kinase
MSRQHDHRRDDSGNNAIDDLTASIARRLASPRPAGAPLRVGIDGAGGAGKSTFAGHLAERLRGRDVRVETVHMDDFYLPSAERTLARCDDAMGTAFDWQRLRDQVLLPLRSGRRAAYQRYDWGTDALAEWHAIPEVQVVLVEGIYVLHCELRALYDVTVWIDCPREVRLARGLARDGPAARPQWEEEWMPAEDRYIASQQPDRAASWRFTALDPHALVPRWRLL